MTGMDTISLDQIDTNPQYFNQPEPPKPGVFSKQGDVYKRKSTAQGTLIKNLIDNSSIRMSKVPTAATMTNPSSTNLKVHL